jgi:hypothetical protein
VERSASCPGNFTSEERATTTHSLIDLVGPRDRLTPVVKDAIYITSTKQHRWSGVQATVWWLNNHGLTPSRDKRVLSSPKLPDKTPIQPHIHFVPAANSFGIKRLGHGADHTTPCGVKANNVWNNSSIPQYALIVLSGNTLLFITFMTSSVNSFSTKSGTWQLPSEHWHVTAAIRTLAWPISLQSSYTMTKLMGLGGVNKFRLY